jgi:pimeloyl-ACP methyl ester carboxylesterase
VVLEDPPGGMARGNEELAHGVELDADLARLDRERLVRRSQGDHPGWAADDVEYDVRGIELADAGAVAAGLRAGLRGWDLPALVGAAVDRAVPVLVLVAPEDSSALTGEARAGVRKALPADRFVELPGGHCLHRDLPDEWLAAVDAFTAAVLPVRG